MIGCTRARIRLRSVEPRTRLCGFVGHADSRMSRMRGSFTQPWPCIPTCAFKGDARGEVHSVSALLANEDPTAPVRDTLVEENELPSARSSPCSSAVVPAECPKCGAPTSGVHMTSEVGGMRAQVIGDEQRWSWEAMGRSSPRKLGHLRHPPHLESLASLPPGPP